MVTTPREANLPGERIGGWSRPMLDNLRMFERGTNLFPRFDPEVQRVYREHAGENALRFHTYVLREGL